MNKSTKALQIVKYLEGIFNGNHILSMGKAAVYTVLVEPPQDFVKETSLVQQWIELKIRKIMFFLFKLRLLLIGFENWNLMPTENLKRSPT